MADIIKFPTKSFWDTDLGKTITEITLSQQPFVDVTQQYKQMKDYYPKAEGKRDENSNIPE
jgi:hypothetical protein